MISRGALPEPVIHVTRKVPSKETTSADGEKITRRQDEKTSIRTSMLSRAALSDAASGSEKDAWGQPRCRKLAGIRVCIQRKQTTTISFQRIIHLHKQNLIPLLLTQVPPFMRWTVEQVV